MLGTDIAKLSDYVHTRILWPGVWKEMNAGLLWLSNGLIIIITITLITRYARVSSFRSVRKQEGRVPTVEDELRIRELLKHYGEHDSLGYFATRRDKRVLFAPDATAAIMYRVLGGVSIASADPIGQEASWPAAVREWLAEATENGWIPGVMASSKRGLRCYQQFGFNALQLGDEAIIEVRDFSAISGRPNPMKKAALRLQLAGYKSRVRRHGDIPMAELQQLDLLATVWRGAEQDRCGFSMALSRFGDPTDANCILVEAVDPSGNLQGFLSLAPWGYCGLSLDLMSRNPTSPSGLSEFMITELVTTSTRLGISRISLTFVMFRTVFEQAGSVGAGPVSLCYQRALGWLSPLIRLKSLYRFTAKCEPQWHLRFSCYRRVYHIPFIVWACLTTEGFLPCWRKPESPRNGEITADFIYAVQEIDRQLPRIQDRINMQTIHHPARIRLDKLGLYRASCEDPYMTSFSPGSEFGEIQEQFFGLPISTRSEKEVKVAGRVATKRAMGKLCFLGLTDSSGKLQAILDTEELGCAQFRSMIRIIDHGDLLGLRGHIVRSRRGELSILVKELVLIAKCFHAFSGSQTKLPYLDMMLHTETHKKLHLRWHIMSVLRRILAQKRFLEIDTATFGKIPGQHLQHLCLSGLSRIFNFRHDPCIGRRLTSTNEHTVLEAYQTYIDYLGTLDLVRGLIQQALCSVYGRNIVARQLDEKYKDISGKWKIITVHAAVAGVLQFPISIETSYDELLNACTRVGIQTSPKASWDQLLMGAFEQLVQPTTQSPTFYIDYPISFSSFTRQHRLDSRLAERWTLVAFGVEVANSISELTDPILYQYQLQQESQIIPKTGNKIIGKDDAFLLALEHGMPPAASFKLSVENLLEVMINCPTNEA